MYRHDHSSNDSPHSASITNAILIVWRKQFNQVSIRTEEECSFITRHCFLAKTSHKPTKAPRSVPIHILFLSFNLASFRKVMGFERTNVPSIAVH
ncbi:hypothetical protein CDAR_202951 [Caerostris darwini]|uniref:Uncharacterized protein n=1 Tax=Caerostris darwini TaxID=1538125 RepID=A0AAV4WAL9_9ARAC|nr:hypothetical protein CDAR_202951 [Caerostris darwini]